ncbi:MAG TPA: serine hydrolase [Pyrinomonadaceae bacterium]|nr:serine hydrolase [Pyrinomonadaceae bacterium]
MIRKLAFCLSLSICLFPHAVSAQQKSVPRAARADARTKTVVEGALGAKVDDYLTRLTGFGYSGAALIIKDGKVILRKGYGLANQPENVPNTPDTVFDIGSLTKQFTAAAILKLEMAGKLKLSDTLGKFFPNAPADKAGITIHQLLTHTGGMPNGLGINHIEITRDELLKRLLSRKLLFKPGSKFEYSNGGYEVLAAVIEVASGEPYREFLRKNLFEPAGMRSTGFWGKAAPRVSPLLIARGYDELGEKGSPLTWSDTTWYGVGSGGVTSTLGDLYKWHLALQNDRILSRAAREKMFTPVMPEAKPSFKDYTSDYGYGWWIQKTPRGTTRIMHGGDSIGFGVQFNWYRDEKILMIVACNIRHDWFPTIIKASRVIPKIIFNEPYEAPPAFRAANARLMSRVVGAYQLPTGGKLIIRTERDRLEIGADGQDATDILREGDEKALKLRAELSPKAVAVLEGMVKSDFTVMAASIPADDDINFWRDGWPDEMRVLSDGKGKFKRVETLGTSTSGNPRLMTTIVRFVFENGYSPYKVTWRDGRIIGLETKSPPLSAVTTMQAASETELVAWNIMSWEPPKPIHIGLKMEGDKVAGLVIRRDGKEWLASRIE